MIINSSGAPYFPEPSKWMLCPNRFRHATFANIFFFNSSCLKSYKNSKDILNKKVKCESNCRSRILYQFQDCRSTKSTSYKSWKNLNLRAFILYEINYTFKFVMFLFCNINSYFLPNFITSWKISYAIIL